MKTNDPITTGFDRAPQAHVVPLEEILNKVDEATERATEPLTSPLWFAFLAILLTAYLTGNSIGFGIGYTNAKSNTSGKPHSLLSSLLQCNHEPFQKVKVLLPGFALGCYTGKKFYSPSK